MLIQQTLILCIIILVAFRYHKRNINNPKVSSQAYATILTIYTFFIILICLILIDEIGEMQWNCC